MADKRTTGPRVIRSGGPRITVAQPTTPPTQVQLGNDRLLPGGREVDWSQLRPDPDQPRKVMDSARLRELAASIATYGLLQPLVVRQEGMAADGDMRYLIIAGGRRHAAIGLAIAQAEDDEARRRLARVPVVVSDTAEAQRRVLQLIENLQREDLNPVEEARALKEIMQIRGLSMELLAASLHRSQGYVDERLRLLRHEEVEAAVEAGLITKSAGAAIGSIASSTLRAEWLQRARQGEVLRPRAIYASKPDRRMRAAEMGTAAPRHTAAVNQPAPATTGTAIPAPETGRGPEGRTASSQDAAATAQFVPALEALLRSGSADARALLDAVLALGARHDLSCQALRALISEG